MTTIAYKDGIVAYDSRRTNDDLIVDDDCDKCFRLDGYAFFMCGSFADIEQFVPAYVAQTIKGDYSCSGLMVTPDKDLFIVGCDEDGPWREAWPKDKPRALGSGTSFALAAMDFGCSAKQAVKYAATRDCGTGGKVRTFKLTK